MGYKMKPNKGAKKRFKATATGKLKHRHSLSTHLRSGRSPKKKRQLGRPGILFEGIAKRMRRAMGIEGMRPAKVVHERALAAKHKAAGEAVAAE